MAEVLTKVILTYPNPLMWAINDIGAQAVCRDYGLNYTMMDREKLTITFTALPGSPLEKVFTPEEVKALREKGVVKVELIYSQ